MIKITVKGLVQGIGFRPFVAELAEQLHIRGCVKNTAGIVTIYANGADGDLALFREQIRTKCPTPGFVSELTTREVADDEDISFIPKKECMTIVASDEGERDLPVLPVDLPTCAHCLDELQDVRNRRYRYPFISCVACGPRYTIMQALPYDRNRITMDDFNMCEDCYKEYIEKGNRRRHAQTIACHHCGPKLSFMDVSSKDTTEGENALVSGIEFVRKGGILAIKDIGGYHLACLACDEQAIRAIRQIKGREKKPLALMVLDVHQARSLCQVNDREAKELTSVARPIVLCQYHKELPTTNLICGNSKDLGLMLPCNPLQQMLVEKTGPLIMTSANRTTEPMLIAHEEVLQWLMSIKDLSVPIGIWSHERKILVPLDDSVVRIVANRRQLVRRARGYVPQPIYLDEPVTVPTLAMGGDLKATFAYAYGNCVIPSGQMGDLEDYDCARAYHKELKRCANLFQIDPKRILCDLHPGYQSGNYGEELAQSHKLEIAKYQHHACHAASVLAEHGLKGDVIAIAMDGTGYGTDGSIWGSEVFLWQNGRMIRKGHLKTRRLPGGDAGAKNTEALAYAYLQGISENECGDLLHVAPWLNEERMRLVRQAMTQGIHTIDSSSMGRFFDAVAAILGICLYNDYEGQAPCELEYAAYRADSLRGIKPLEIPVREEEDMLIGDVTACIRELVSRMTKQENAQDLAYAFIDGVAKFIYDEVSLVAMTADTKTVALSGGTFLNRMLTERIVTLLEQEGYQVYMNEQVPVGDGGLALGQIYLSQKDQAASQEE